MTKQFIISFIVLVCLFSCASCKKSAEAPKSMEQIYAETGRPVETRVLEPEPFSVSLKFPADYKSRSESTAYAKIGDVVRRVNVKVGDRVKQDGIVLVLSEDNANYLQAKLQVENAQTSFSRMEKLYRESGVSKQDYDNARTQLSIAREALRSIEEMIRIKAPISGTITQLNVQVSSNVQPDTPLFTVSNQNGYETNFYVLPNEISDIHEGARAFIDYGGERFSGHIAEVSMTMDARIRAFPCKAFFDVASEKQSRFLVSGMRVDVTVEAYGNDKAIVLAQSEMTRSGETWSAYVVKDGTAVKRTLTLGRQQGLSRAWKQATS